MLPYILIGLAVVVLAFIVAVSTRPNEFRVERATVISAPAPLVFEQVNDLHKFQEWSPWAKMDPTCKTTFEGPAAGTGAVFSWAGNNKVGEGRMTIIESRSSELVRMKLDFLKPFKAVNIAEFVFKSAGDQTTVTWSMTGKNNFFFKVFGLFMNFDKMVGCQFAQGLANLKVLTEKAVVK